MFPVLFINIYLIVYFKLVNINTLSFEQNSAKELNVKQLKLIFHVDNKYVGSSLNYEIRNGIHKMLFLFIYLFIYFFN
jgi:hypothetical protein